MEDIVVHYLSSQLLWLMELGFQRIKLEKLPQLEVVMELIQLVTRFFKQILSKHLLNLN